MKIKISELQQIISDEIENIKNPIKKNNSVVQLRKAKNELIGNVILKNIIPNVPENRDYKVVNCVLDTSGYFEGKIENIINLNTNIMSLSKNELQLLISNKYFIGLFPTNAGLDLAFKPEILDAMNLKKVADQLISELK